MTETPAEYFVSKAPKPLRRLDYLRKRIQNWFTALRTEGRCYAIGTASVIVAAAVAVFKRPEAGFLAQVGLFVFALGLLPLTERLYEWAWRKLIGKLFIAALVALATNLAYGFGRQMVAGLIRTSPEPFGATVNVTTILFTPVLFLMFLAIGGTFIFIIALYIGSLALMAVLPSATPGKGKRDALWLCRFVALAIAVFGSMAVLSHKAGYTGWVERRTADYLYAFDMYHDALYAPGKTEKVALLGDGRILLASRDQDEGHYKFRIEQIGMHGDAPEITDDQSDPKRWRDE